MRSKDCGEYLDLNMEGVTGGWIKLPRISWFAICTEYH